MEAHALVHVHAVEEVPADVPADDPMLEEDQPGAPGGAPCSGYMPPEVTIIPQTDQAGHHHGKELAAHVHGLLGMTLQRRYCFVRRTVDLAGRRVGVYDLCRHRRRSLSEGPRMTPKLNFDTPAIILKRKHRFKSHRLTRWLRKQTQKIHVV